MQQDRALSVCIAGTTGWTGRALVRGVLGAADLRLGGAVSRLASGQDLGVALGGEPLRVAVHGSVGDARNDIDVLIDYTSSTVVKATRSRRSTPASPA
jgi:dihydrodipicolinate reductase